MAYSEKTYTGDGTTTDFAVTFDYLDQSHVKVSVNKVLTTTVGSDYKFTWNNSTNIRVDTVIDGNPVPTGLEIRLIRGTPIATPAVVFGGAASLSSENLNKNSEYLTFALQEATDANEEFTKLYLGAFASAPTVDNEGEALQVGAVYYDSVLSALYYWTGATWIIGESTAAAGIFREAAEAARDAAIVAQDAAVVAQGAAEAAAGDAVSDAASAVAAALATAQGSADDAAGSASAAGTSASQASTSESNANDSATAAAASAASVDTVKLAGIETGAQVNRDLASQAEAEAGTDNTKVMTPLRTNEAVIAGRVPDCIFSGPGTNNAGTIPLDTTIRNVGGFATLSTNQVTLAAGTYRIVAHQILRAKSSFATLASCSAAIQDVTDSNTNLIAAALRTASRGDQGDVRLEVVVTTASSNVYLLDFATDNGTDLVASSGSLPSGHSGVNVEDTYLEIWRL